MTARISLAHLQNVADINLADQRQRAIRGMYEGDSGRRSTGPVSTPLPQRRPDGTLPPGRHQIAALGDLFAAFPATTPKRQALNTALVQLVDVIGRLALATHVVIDGSYLTGKAEPEDVDLALLSTGASETATLGRLQHEGVDLALLDVFVETTVAGFDNWVTFYSADRNGNLRGVVVLTM